MESEALQKGEDPRLGADYEASNSLSMVSPRAGLVQREEEKCASTNPKKKKKITKGTKGKEKEKKRGGRKGKSLAVNIQAEQEQNDQPDPAQVSMPNNIEPIEQRCLPTIKPVWESLQSHNLETFHQDIDRTYFSQVSTDHFEKLKQCLSNQPMHISELLNNVAAKPKSGQSNLIQYLALLEELKKETENEYAVLLEWREKYGVIFYSTSENKQNMAQIEKHKGLSENQEYSAEQNLSTAGFLELTCSEYALLKIRHLFMTELSNKLKKYNQNRPSKSQLDQISKEILFFNNLLSVETSKIKHQIQHLEQLARVDEQKQQISAAAYQDEYISLILKKNIKYSLDYSSIDVMSYFKMRSCIQQNKKFQPFANMKDLSEYIKKKMVRKTKKTKYPLSTACKGCLSNYYQQYNTFKNCYECGSRFHKLCLSISNNLCTICEGRRLKRTLTPECILCSQRGFMYKTLSQNNNIHVWCALAFGLFKVKDKAIELFAPQMMEESDEQCFICQKNTGKLIRCSCESLCNKHVHPSCAYLSGYHLSMPPSSTIAFNCQINSQPDQLLQQQFNRCYVLNYNKIAYSCFSIEEFKKSKQIRAPKTSKSNASEENGVEEEEMAGGASGGSGAGNKKDGADEEVPFIESD